MPTCSEVDEQGRPFAFLTRWWRNWVSRDAALRELAGCGERETSHLARDIGVGVTELKTLAGRWPDSSNLLERRMVALGLGADRIGRDQPALMRDLQRVCGQCAQESRCEQDLRRNEARG